MEGLEERLLDPYMETIHAFLFVVAATPHDGEKACAHAVPNAH